MNRIPSLQELCLGELDTRYINPRWCITLGSGKDYYFGHSYRCLNLSSIEEEEKVFTLIESACSHVLQKMYGEASELGPAVFSRNATQQFFYLRKWTKIAFQEISKKNVSDSRINALIVSLFHRQTNVSIQEKIRIRSRYVALLDLLAQVVPEEIFDQFRLKKQEDFYPSLFFYILNRENRIAPPFVNYFTEALDYFNHDADNRFMLAQLCVTIAAIEGDYETLERGVEAMRELYTFGEPISSILNWSVEKALWKQDLAVVVRLIQLGADVTSNLHIMSGMQAISLGRPELASKRYNVCELASYLYPDEPEEPIVSLIKEEYAKQIARQPPPCKRRPLETVVEKP